MITDTNLVPRLKRHGRLSRDMTCTVKRGVLPAWYQYCGEDTTSDRRSNTQACAGPAAGDGSVLRCREGAEVESEAGDGVGDERCLLACSRAELVAPAWGGDAAWPALEG